MTRHALLLVLLALIACSSPEKRRVADVEAEQPRPVIAASPSAEGEGGSDWFSSMMEDVWRDSVAGWSAVTRSVTRNTERDWARIVGLFD